MPGERSNSNRATGWVKGSRSIPSADNRNRSQTKKQGDNAGKPQDNEVTRVRHLSGDTHGATRLASPTRFCNYMCNRDGLESTNTLTELDPSHLHSIAA